MALKQEVEQATAAKHSHRQLGRERRVFRLDVPLQFRVQNFAGVCPFCFYSPQYFEGYFSCCANRQIGRPSSDAHRSQTREQ